MSLGLRAGEWVVVRSKEEILATLDANGRLDGLPFQPEMFAWCGRRARVAKSAHKTCDSTPHRTRRASHVRRRAPRGCALRWRLARRLPGRLCLLLEGSLAEARQRIRRATLLLPETADCTEESVLRSSLRSGCDSADPIWVCQTTAIYEATELLPLVGRASVHQGRDQRQSLGVAHDARSCCARAIASSSGSASATGCSWACTTVFRSCAAAGRCRPLPERVPDGAPTPAETLDLQPGEWVEVKSREEIAATITRSGFNRGMRYDLEMLKYSGRALSRADARRQTHQ